MYNMNGVTKPRTTPFPEQVLGAKWIPLTRGLFALVDDEDYDRVRHLTWSAQKSVRTFYAVRGYRINGKFKMDLLHRVIMNAPDAMQVDHIDANGLNCRRANMRVCTVKENHRNMRKPLSAKTSPFKGVHWATQRAKWVARIHWDDKGYTLGYFDDEIAAAQRYNREARLRFGEFALLNPV